MALVEDAERDFEDFEEVVVDDACTKDLGHAYQHSVRLLALFPPRSIPFGYFQAGKLGDGARGHITVFLDVLGLLHY